MSYELPGYDAWKLQTPEEAAGYARHSDDTVRMTVEVELTDSNDGEVYTATFSKRVAPHIPEGSEDDILDALTDELDEEWELKDGDKLKILSIDA